MNVVFLFGCATLNAKHDQTQVAWLDASVVEAVRNGARRHGAVDPMALEPRDAFLLDGDNDLIAAQQTCWAVVRGADAENPGLVFHLCLVLNSKEVFNGGGVLIDAGKPSLLLVTACRVALRGNEHLRRRRDKSHCRTSH